MYILYSSSLLLVYKWWGPNNNPATSTESIVSASLAICECTRNC